MMDTALLIVGLGNALLSVLVLLSLARMERAVKFGMFAAFASVIIPFIQKLFKKGSDPL